ncbi:hypothetical protein C0992_010911 [Termitomyces sp. T32_za158]|nr:hypothetical protein C0992_010911 [Termitomyces sp. T32_za158]
MPNVQEQKSKVQTDHKVYPYSPSDDDSHEESQVQPMRPVKTFAPTTSELGKDPQSLGSAIRNYPVLAKFALDFLTNIASVHPVIAGRKFLKSPILEARLAEYASKFLEYETRIQNALTMQTYSEVHSVHGQLKTMQDQIQSLFKQMDTPYEREIRRIIKENGPRNSVNDTQILQRLLQMAGDGISDYRENVNANLDETKKSLLRELAEDVDDAHHRNTTLLEGKLEILSRQMKDEKDELNKVIVRQAVSGGHEEIVDPVCSINPFCLCYILGAVL